MFAKQQQAALPGRLHAVGVVSSGLVCGIPRTFGLTRGFLSLQRRYDKLPSVRRSLLSGQHPARAGRRA